METLIRRNDIAGWYGGILDLIRDLRETKITLNISGVRTLANTVKKHIVRAHGTSSKPGYIAVIQKNGMVRISSSRRPKAQTRNLQAFGKDTLLLWYGFTENMLETKKVAMKHFEFHRVRGDWLDVPAEQVVLFLKEFNKRKPEEIVLREAC